MDDLLNEFITETTENLAALAATVSLVVEGEGVA